MSGHKNTLMLLWLQMVVVLGACLAQESDGPTGNKGANLEVDVQILPPQAPDVFDPSLVWYVTAQVGADPVEVDGTLCGRPLAPARNALLRVPKRSGPLALRVHVVGPDGQHRALGSGAAALMEIDVALTVDQWTRKDGPWTSPCLNGRDGGSNTPDLRAPQDMKSLPPDLKPPPQCSLDSDCRNQQVCFNNKCVACYRDFHCTNAAKRFCQIDRNECSECRPSFNDCGMFKFCITPPARANQTNFCGTCTGAGTCSSNPRLPQVCCRGFCAYDPPDNPLFCDW